MTETMTSDFMDREMEQTRVAVPKKSRLAEVFGELADPKFYLHLLKVAIAEVIKAAVLTFAGTVAWYVQSKITRNDNIPVNYGGPNNTTTNNSSSYSGQSRPLSGSERDSYFGRSNYMPTQYTAPTKGETFPGFGNR